MEERSGIWWLGIITAGVILGNTISFGAQEMYSTWKLHNMLEAAGQAMKELNQQAKEERYQQKIEAEKKAHLKTKERKNLQYERRTKESRNTTFRETCNFWIKESKKEPTATNLNYRNTACAKVNMIFR